MTKLALAAAAALLAGCTDAGTSGDLFLDPPRTATVYDDGDSFDDRASTAVSAPRCVPRVNRVRMTATT